VKNTPTKNHQISVDPLKEIKKRKTNSSNGNYLIRENESLDHRRSKERYNTGQIFKYQKGKEENEDLVFPLNTQKRIP